MTANRARLPRLCDLAPGMQWRGPGARRQRVGLVTVQEQNIVAPEQGRLRIWTIVKPVVWERLLVDETLYVDPELAYPGFADAYDWMRRQMAKRIRGYSGHYPWWAWAYPKPDLRSTDYHFAPAGQLWLRLAVDLPVGEVLCSEYLDWHVVLNNGYFARDWADAEAWDARPPELQSQESIERSWERLLDYGAPRDEEYWGAPQVVQAVFETLRLADVSEVRAFRSRSVPYRR